MPAPELPTSTAFALVERAKDLASHPQDGERWRAYLTGLVEAGLDDAAKQVLDQGRRLGLAGEAIDRIEATLLARRGDRPGADINDLIELGRHADAEFVLRALLIEHDARGDVWSMLAAAVQRQGRLEEALDLFRISVERWPQDQRLLYNFGQALLGSGRFEAAEDQFRSAIARDPQFSPAIVALARALIEMARAEEARSLLEVALRQGLVDSALYSTLGASLALLDDPKGAREAYEAALALDPSNTIAHCNLANLLVQADEPLGAEAHYREAIRLNPSLAEAFINLGELLRLIHRLAEGEALCRRGLALEPSSVVGHQLLVVLSSYLSKYEELVADSDRTLALAPDAASWETRLYTFSYHPDLSAEAIFEEFVRWGDRFPDPATDFSAHDRTPGRRLKIGYVSPDFRKHTSRFYFMPLMANHDHQAFETYAYSNVLVEDEHTEAFKGVFDHWRGIRGLSDREVAELVRRDGVDILVDCCNHMRDDRLDVFALKPAPIQVTWLGAAWTTGLKTVDYVLFDPYIAPEGTIAREEIVRLPHCFIAYRPPETTAEVAPLPALRGGQVTFGYSGRTERLNHHTFRVWGEILRRVPGSKLILDYHPFADPPTQEHYRQLMARHGLDPDRVEMRRSPNIFEGLGDIDILLDCFPHSGGTMLFDALWMGVPALTLKARPPLGRIGATLMTNLGMTDWVAETEEDYIDKALAFAADIPALAKIRAGLRERMKASPLMDEQGFAKGVEDAYRAMWARWLGSEAGSDRARVCES